MPAAPPSLRTLATLTGYSLGTVSMALRGDHRISAKTRTLILRAAEEQGYAPDPLLAGRMNHVRRRTSSRQPVKLAHVVAWTSLAAHYEFGPFRDFREGAASRAREFGYELEDFLLDDLHMPPQRLADILRARAIPGVLLAPVQRPEVIQARLAAGDPWLKLDFTAYSTIGHSLGRTRISRTVHDHAGALELAHTQLTARGYRRIGLVLSEFMHERVSRRWLSGWVCTQTNLLKAPRPLISTNLEDPSVFDPWIDQEQPDAIITCDWNTVYLHLARRRIRIPADLGLVDLQSLVSDSPRAAVDQCNHEVGAAAIDIILAQINRHERGEPAIPKTVLIPGRWIEGPSIRPLTASAGMSFHPPPVETRLRAGRAGRR